MATDLEALLGIQRNTKVAFLSGQDRPVFPTKTPVNRLGAGIASIRGHAKVGPGSYNNDAATSLKHMLDAHVESKLGYSLGARTAARIGKHYMEFSPSPGEYQNNPLEKRETSAEQQKKSHPPFLIGEVNRFKAVGRLLPSDSNPGPGTYEHDTSQNRKVVWQSSFGSAPINLPKAEIQSTIPLNSNKLAGNKEYRSFQRRLAYLKLYY